MIEGPMGRRLGARLVDETLWGLLATAVVARGSFRAAVTALLLLTIAPYLIEVTFVRLGLGSVGKLSFGLRVVTVDGERLTLGQSARRVALVQAWPVSLLVAVGPYVGDVARTALLLWNIVLLVTTIRSPERRGLHDRLARTTVVSVAPPVPVPEPLPPRKAAPERRPVLEPLVIDEDELDRLWRERA